MLLGELSFLQKEMVYSGKVAGALSLDTEVKGVLLKQEKSLPLSPRGTVSALLQSELRSAPDKESPMFIFVQGGGCP